MKVLHSLDDARTLAGVALALGNFDGVHLGHQALFAEAAEHGRARRAHLRAPPGQGAPAGAGAQADHAAAPQARAAGGRRAGRRGGAALHPRVRPHAGAGLRGDALRRARVRAVVVGGDYTYGAQRAGTVATLTRGGHGPWGSGGVVDAGDGGRRGGLVLAQVREYILEGRVGAARRAARSAVRPGRGGGDGRRARAGASASPPPTWTPTSELRPRPGCTRSGRGPGETAVARWGGQHRGQADLRRRRR